MKDNSVVPIMPRLVRTSAVLVALACSACQSVDNSGPSVFADQDVFGDYNRFHLPHKASPEAYGAAVPRTPGRTLLTQTFDPDSGARRIADVKEESPGEFALNFENADIKDVVRGILTDALDVNYTITGDLAGPVTLSSAQPVSRERLLGSLESALSSFGYALNKEGTGYRIGPAGSGGGTVDRGSAVSAGTGISVVPLRFVTGATMLELLSGFVVANDGLRVEKSGNSVIVRGTGPQRAEAVEAVKAFDADFMQGQSVSIFRLAQARPEAVIPELERIFSTTSESSLIQFRPVDRVRGIMAISKNAVLLRRAESWVRRLDQDRGEAGDHVVVYKARYRKAAELAKVVSNLFGGGATDSSSLSPNPASPQAPDADPAAGASFKPTAGSTANGNDPSVRVASAFDDLSTSSPGLGKGPGVIDLTHQGGSSASSLRISADPSNNSVVILGDSDRTRDILTTLRRLDAVPVQVAINVTIAEVQLTNELKYGVQYYLASHRLGLGSNNGSVSLTDAATDVLANQIPGLNAVFGSAANPDVIISALDVIGNVEVLSSPSLIVLENQTASLQVGDEVPITTRQIQSIDSGTAPLVNQVEFKNTGIILNVTPRISQDDTVTMDIAQEISSVAGGANTLTPTISKRRVESEISVNNAQTVVLAGLISASRNNTKDGVPGLNRVPIVRELFGSTERTNNRTELIVLIRPLVIRDQQDADNVAASLRAKMGLFAGTSRLAK